MSLRRSVPLLLLLAATSLQAEVKLSRPFGDHMVLQREMPVPIRGTADPNESVTVEFRDQKKTTSAGADGKWMVKLDPLKPGGPDTLTAGARKLEDVLVGDVWLGSGQSNMAMGSTQYLKNDPVLAANAQQTYPKLRLLTGPGNWSEASPQTIPGFSCLLFSFGLPLQKGIDVPVGLMVGAVGGTPSGYWLSEKMYREDPGCQQAVKDFIAANPSEAREAAHAAARKAYDDALPIWQAQVEQARAEGKPLPQGPRDPGPLVAPGESSGKIGNLFEQHIRPLLGFAIKGVYWDQGEANTSIVGVDQYTLMGALIRGWRQEWGQGDFPWIYTEKPSGGGPAWDPEHPVTDKGEKFTPLPQAIPAPPTGAYTHANYLRIMDYPKTYMVTGIDLGRGTHPTNKSGYGARAARVALATVYGRPLEWLGPIYASHEITGDRISVKFTHTGKGLAFKPGPALQGFMIAGEDQKFVWAEAQIAGETVVVSSKDVPQPKAVRYAWSPVFPWANLFNQDGLPAQPFRTDSW